MARLILNYICLIAIFTLLTLVAKADNPPYPCGTWQQSGRLCIDGNLYPGNCGDSYYYPKERNAVWLPLPYPLKHNGSDNWFYLYCGGRLPDEFFGKDAPLDENIYMAAIGLFGAWFVRRKYKSSIGLI